MTGGWGARVPKGGLGGREARCSPSARLRRHVTNSAAPPSINSIININNATATPTRSVHASSRESCPSCQSCQDIPSILSIFPPTNGAQQSGRQNLPTACRWLRDRDSNPDRLIQSQVSYHWT